jgi:hypothetical protein
MLKLSRREDSAGRRRLEFPIVTALVAARHDNGLAKLQLMEDQIFASEILASRPGLLRLFAIASPFSGTYRTTEQKLATAENLN